MPVVSEIKKRQNGVYLDLVLAVKLNFFSFFSQPRAWSAFYLFNEPKIVIIANTSQPERVHAHNDTDLWDREST